MAAALIEDGSVRNAYREIVGLVGENGSGKSTIKKILVGDLQADDGTVIRTERFGCFPRTRPGHVLLVLPLIDNGIVRNSVFDSSPPAWWRSCRAGCYVASGTVVDRCGGVSSTGDHLMSEPSQRSNRN